MNRLTRWHLLERFWEPVRRQLFLARQLRAERDFWKWCAGMHELVADDWKKRAEACEEAHSSQRRLQSVPPELR